jgi:UPF0716 protein FxsA
LQGLRYLPRIIFVIFLVELASLVWLGGHIGVLPVLAITILDVIIGSALIRKSGTNIFSAMNSRSFDAKAVSSGAADSVFDALAGLLFIIPGLVSDVIALILLLPWIRKRFARLVEPHVSARMTRRSRGPVIDADVVEIDGSTKFNTDPARD